jgi:acetate kinase
MNVLVLNCGSSSFKFQVVSTSLADIQAASDLRLARGSVERIGMPNALVWLEVGKQPAVRETRPIADHREAIQHVLQLLRDPANGVLPTGENIDVVGHRVVHGGEFFSASMLITPEVLSRIEECIDLAPLHVPANLRGCQMTEELLTGVPQVAVFDTSFHQSMPPHAYLYGIPYEQYTHNKLRRYGFHGTSHRYVCYRLRSLLGIPRRSVNVISCHLGNGCSIAAIANGESLDTTMGLTPLEGLMMGTRCGDLDPGAVFRMIGHDGLSVGDVDTILNRKSGLLGVSGLSSDMRELLGAAEAGHERARLAIQMFCYRVTKGIAAYLPVVGPTLHAIVFTGGIGENSPEIRRRIVEPLGMFGIELDPQLNHSKNPDVISTPASTYPVRVIPMDEELVIARDAVRAVEKAQAAP